MNILPIDKQCEIMDLIYQKLPDREIATRANIPKSTVQNYKKRGPPIYRKHAKNPLDNPYLKTGQDELKVARQQLQGIQLINSKLIMERNTADRIANDLQKKHIWKDTEIERLNFEKKEKETELNFLYGKFNELVTIAKNQSVIIKKLKDENIRKDDMIKNIQETLQQNKIDLAKADEGKKFYNDKIRELTIQRDEFKDKAESLERQHEFDWMLNLAVALVGFLGGIVTDRMVLPKIKEFILSWGVEHGINTEGYANQFSSVNGIQRDTYNVHNEVTPKTYTSSTTLYSGVFITNYGETHAAGCEPIPNQLDGITQAGIYHIDSGVTLSTNTSDALISGAYPQTYRETSGTGYDMITNQFNEMQESPIFYENSGVEMITKISGSQAFGTYVSSHLEHRALQDTTTIQASPPLFIPSYSYMPLTPPTNPSDSLLWQQILKTNEKQFKQHLKRFFEHLGDRVTLGKGSHDKGADLILERGWEKIVVQLKQWKDNVGFSSIQEAHTAITLCNATRAMIICTSSFTKPVKDEAEKLHVELWDGKRLLEELYKHHYFLSPELN